MSNEIQEKTAAHLASIITEQLARVERMKQAEEWADYSELKPIIIGVCWGDGIGPIISQETQRVLEVLVGDLVEAGKIEFRTIEGLTIENRVEHMKAIPDDVLAELKACHVVLKAPTTTPEKGGPYPNIESANVAMRRELDLFANVRPVKVAAEGIDWTFFRENTEGAYILGSKGIMVTEDLALDFKVSPARRAALWAHCATLTERVLDAGGKFYFAKDLVIGPDAVQRMFPADKLAAFLELKRELDPEGLLQTNLSRRLCKPDHAGCADRIGRKNAARGVPGNVAILIQ